MEEVVQQYHMASIEDVLDMQYLTLVDSSLDKQYLTHVGDLLNIQHIDLRGNLPDLQSLALQKNSLLVGYMAQLEDAHDVIHLLVEYRPFAVHSPQSDWLVTLDISPFVDSPKQPHALHTWSRYDQKWAWILPSCSECHLCLPSTYFPHDIFCLKVLGPPRGLTLV
jgi:hypothetical protein